MAEFTKLNPSLGLPRWLATILPGYAVLGGILTLAGWLLALPRLTDWAGSGISMFPNAALASVFTGSALILAKLAVNHPRLARLTVVLGLVVTAIGGGTVVQHLFRVDFGLDTLLIAPAWGNKAAMAPGRIGPPASTSFTLLGIALVLIGIRRPKAQSFVPPLGLAVCVIASLSLLGYISGADPLFEVARYTGIAMQTASILLALGLGVLGAVPEYEPMRTVQQDSAAGLLARRSLPFIIVVPVVLGWVRDHGQRSGWFDNAMGTSLLSLLLIIVVCVMSAPAQVINCFLAVANEHKRPRELGLLEDQPQNHSVGLFVLGR